MTAPLLCSSIAKGFELWDGVHKLVLYRLLGSRNFQIWSRPGPTPANCLAFATNLNSGKFSRTTLFKNSNFQRLGQSTRTGLSFWFKVGYSKSMIQAKVFSESNKPKSLLVYRITIARSYLTAADLRPINHKWLCDHYKSWCDLEESSRCS